MRLGKQKNIPRVIEFHSRGIHVINRTNRAMIYLIISAGLGAIGFFISSGPTEYTSGVIFLILGLILTTSVEILIELTAEEALPVDIIQGERRLKDKYKELRKDAILMNAVWCSRYAEVTKYFREEIDDLQRNEKLVVRRLINPKVVKKDYKNHLKNTEELRKLDRYIIKTTDLTELECVVCEYEMKDEKSWKALFVFNDLDNNTPGLGILLDPSKKPKSKASLAAVKGWFEDEWLRGEDV